MTAADTSLGVAATAAATDGRGRDLARLFTPRSIAIVGASANLNSIGGQPIKHLQAHGYAGQIYPVNPKYDEIAGLRCYPSLADLPAAPDVVVVAVAARLVEPVIEQVGAKGTPFAIVFSSGFAETGTDGHAAQQRLLDVAKAAGVTLIGPNCQGLMNISSGIRLGFGAPYALEYRTGGVSLTSQSGAFGNSLLMALDDEGVGLRHYISTGNEAATTSLDCIEHFLDDPDTRVIAGYVEGFRDAYRLRALGRKALERNTPLVFWKVGNTEVGAQAASSHTANLAGEATYYEATFRQFGIVGVQDIGDMADCVRALQTGRRPKGNGVAVLSISGGAGIAMADRCVELGLELPPLSEATIEQLRPLLPAFASLANPLDLTAGALDAPESFAAALRVILADPAVDMLALCLAALAGPSAAVVAQAIADAAAASDVPILVAWNPPRGAAQEAERILEQANIPVYGSPVRCARGFAALWIFAEAAGRLASMDAMPAVRPPAALEEGATTLNEFQSKQLLARYGLPITREAVAHNEEEAVRLAREIGYPVVLKILSTDLPHKSDVGGVKVGLADDDAVRQSFQSLAALPDTLTQRVRFEGVLVQEMVKGGVEVILGAVNDASFGPMVMFGAGGIYAEVFEDVAFCPAPMSREDAEALIARTRISRILRGARGRPVADIPALINAILSLAELCVHESARFTEIDVNPLLVLPAGKGARVVDALARMR